MNPVKILFILVVLTIPVGQLSRFEIAPNVTIYLSDVLIPTLTIVWLIYAGAIKRKIFIPPFSLRIFFFISLACLSLLIGSFHLNSTELIISSLFLVRFIEYVLLYFIGVDLFRSVAFRVLTLKTLILTGFIVSILGFLQLIVIPDFAELSQQGGWDPHQYRLLSTFFDPNFVGGFLVIIAAFIINYLFFKPKKIERVVLIGFAITLTVAIVLTFSRSTYLAFFSMLGILGLLHSRRLFLTLMVLGAVAFSLIPPVQNRLVQAVNLDDSARARLVSWENALTIARDQPIFGVGFNSYRFTQERYGFLRDDGGHSGSGADSSLLLILATTGIVGLSSYLFILFGLFKFALNSRKSMLSAAFLAGAGSLIIHSQFVNSLLYPQILAVFWIGAALMVADKRYE